MKSYMAIVVIDVSSLFGDAISGWVLGKSLGMLHEYDTNFGSLKGDFRRLVQDDLLLQWVH